MKLVIFGAGGQTGRLLTEQALEQGHQVTAYVRRPESVTLTHPALTVVAGQLSDAALLEATVKGADACISVLGGNSLTRHATEILSGIGNIIAAMEKAGTKRLLYMSSIGAGDSRYYMGGLIRFFIVGLMLRIPLADHTTNEKRIMQSNLSWTLVRPTGLGNGPRTGSFRHGSEAFKMTGNSQVSRADVAAFILSEAVKSEYVRKAAWMIGG
jgi:putative NADH-flavin reductase